MLQKKYNKAAFELKVLGNKTKKGDFTKYVNNWKNKYPNWEMIVNHEISADQFSLVEGLDGNTSIKGIKNIIYIIENELNSNKRRKLADFMNISRDLCIQDYVSQIIKDLMEHANKGDAIPFDTSTLKSPKEKIQLNFNREDWDGVNSQMVDVMKDFPIILNIISGYEDYEKDMLKHRIIDDYNKLGGDFKTRLNNLTDQYTKRYANLKDDEYRLSVKTILLYMFEQCLIGEKITEA